MKKLLLSLILLFCGWITAKAQSTGTIYIAGTGNDYVYVDNSYVYTSDDVRLNSATSLMYMRRDGQLLQGGNTANRGLGFLSTYQEGTVNNYAYNYWCAPVGIPTASVGNDMFGLGGFYSPSTVTTSSLAAITTGLDGTASPFTISDYWIWKFLSSNTYGQWISVKSTPTLATGEGFTMKGTSGTDATSILGVANNSGSKQRYDFRGKPNNGDITITVANGSKTLTGNPYPSTIDLSAFLTAATNCTGIAYFWEQDNTVNSHYLGDYKGGYGTFSPVSRGGTGIYVPATFYSYDGSGNQGGVYSNPNNYYERRFSPIGQGFMIEGNASGTTVTMKNAYRVYAKEGAATFSQFEKGGSNRGGGESGGFLSKIPSVSGFDYTKVSIAPVPQIRFNALMNGVGVRQMVLGFSPEATDDADRAMDALSPSDDVPADAYFVMNDKEYVIDIIDYNINKKIPIGFKNKEIANFKIAVKEILSFTEADKIYLHDKTTDMFYDIKNTFYEMTLPAGVNNTQYEITFKNGDIIPEATQTLEVLLNNDTRILTAYNPQKLELSSCSLYDVTGKLIFEKKGLGTNTSYEFPIPALSDGIYIVKLTTKANSEINKKVIIKN